MEKTEEGSNTAIGVLDEYAKKLERRLWNTKGIRFAAENRLEMKSRASTLAISILSMYVIGVTVLEVLVPAERETALTVILLPLATIIAPVFIMALSEYESAKQYLVRGERMHRTAQAVQEYHSRLEFLRSTGSLTQANVDQIRQSYEAVLRDFSSNHDTVDYHYFQSLHVDRFMEFEKSLWRRFKLTLRGRIAHYVDVWSVPLLLVLIPGALLLVAIASILAG